MSDTKNIFAALVKAQRAFGTVLKAKNNPAFKGSKYADLGACFDAVMGPLNEAGVAVIQNQHPHEGGVCVETVFLHESGEMYSAGKLTVPAQKQDPQGYGSALTYARRYSLMAACGMAPEDDDGNAASKPTSNAAAALPPSQTPMPDSEISAWVEHVTTSPDKTVWAARLAETASACGGDAAAVAAIKAGIEAYVEKKKAASAKTKEPT